MNPNAKRQEYLKTIDQAYTLIKSDFYDKSRGKTINRYKGQQAPCINHQQFKA
jgi:hypothetical protein